MAQVIFQGKTGTRLAALYKRQCCTYESIWINYSPLYYRRYFLLLVYPK